MHDVCGCNKYGIRHGSFLQNPVAEFFRCYPEREYSILISDPVKSASPAYPVLHREDRVRDLPASHAKHPHILPEGFRTYEAHQDPSVTDSR